MLTGLTRAVGSFVTPWVSKATASHRGRVRRGDEDLPTCQAWGLSAGDGSRRVSSDLLDDGVARGTRD